MSQTNGTIRIGAFTVDFNQVLGKGATGYVYKGVHSDTLEPVAVKAIEMSQVNNEVTQYLLEGEKKAMMTIKNPYVVRTHDIIQQKDYCYIAMEQCSNGTLKEFIQKKGKLGSEQAIEIFKKIVIGYIAIVQSLFIHRDLKTANILLRTNGDPVIIDFGYCEMIMGKRPMIQYNVGSPSYMSPEAYSKSRYSEKSDIWSLGVILHQMLTGRTLDNGINIKQFFKIIESEGKVRINTEGISPVCTEILNATLQVDPEQRATIHKLKYIIDKSQIPIMQNQLKKTQSESSKGSGQELKFVPPAHFNYGPPPLPSKSASSISEKKQKIAENLKLLRSSTQFQRQGDKIIPIGVTNYNPSLERNQHSLIFMHQAGQNAPPIQHSILRKSLQRNQMPEKIMKKIMSVKEVVDAPKLSFKRIPVLQKGISLPPTFQTVQSREGVVSMRII